MSTLHTVNKSPFSTQSLLSCLNHAKDGDAVLMSMTNEAGTIVLGALVGDQKFYVHLVLLGKEHRVVDEGVGVRLTL